MRIVQKSSPNQGARPLGTIVDTIVLHADASPTADASVSWIVSPKSQVSYHVLVDREGTVYTFVPIQRRAWHAGVSSFQGRPNCNDYSIGLAFANKNDGVEPYTDAQYAVGAALCASYMRLHRAITLDRITTHAIVSPGRKSDPKGFDLDAFRALVQQELDAPELRPAA